MRSNLSKSYEIQGPDGPQSAPRPPDRVLEVMNAAPYIEAIVIGQSLSKAGFTLDAMVDISGWNYWKTMAQRREYGYTWVPAAHMPNLLIAPGLWMPSENAPEGGVRYDPDDPPVGAILVPASEAEDPNFVLPEPAPEAPPVKVVFGEKVTEGFYEGAYKVGKEDTAPLYSIQTGPDGGRWMRIHAFMKGFFYVKVD